MLKFKTIPLALFLTLCFMQPIEAEEKQYIVMHCRDGAGLFSIFHDVLAVLKCYERGLYAGVEVDFKKEGQYYDERYGDNWWSYYCEPIAYGDKSNVRHVMGDPPGSISYEIEYHTTRKEARELIGKYIHFKPNILDKINNFQRNNFVGHYVVSVHYRGTDKSTETRAVPYEEMHERVEEIIQKYAGENYRIFIATDEQDFIDYMMQFYGDIVCYNKDAIRSTDGQALHLGNYDKYQCGFDAIVDSVLLSRGHYLVRMSSNLSRWSMFFNPEIPVIELNPPH